MAENGIVSKLISYYKKIFPQTIYRIIVEITRCISYTHTIFFKKGTL